MDGITVVWDTDEKQVIRYIAEGNWTWTDMQNAVNTSNAMLDEIGRVTNFIYDMRASAGVPSGALANLRRFIGKEHRLSGEQVVVGAKRSGLTLLAQGLLDMIYKVYKPKWKLQFADTLEEARAMLEKVEP
jgi:hypothetical protein